MDGSDSGRGDRTNHLPQDAQDLGLTPLTAPVLQLASSLRAPKPSRTFLAWVALLLILAVAVVAIVSIVWA